MKDLKGIIGSRRIRRQERRAEPVRYYASASNQHFRALGLLKFALFGPALRKWTHGTWLRRRVRTLSGGTRRLDLVPVNGAAGLEAKAREAENGVAFACDAPDGRPLPCGWVVCSYEVRRAEGRLRPVLSVDTGNGGPFEVPIPLAEGDRGSPARLVCLPAGRSWRLELPASPEDFELGRLVVEPLTLTTALRSLVSEHGYSLADAVNFLLGGSRLGDASSYDYWIVHHDLLTNRDRTAIRAAVARMTAPPRFTVVVPVEVGAIGSARTAVETVVNQLYPHWELVVVGGDGNGSDPSRWIARRVQDDPRVRTRPDVRGERVVACLNAAIAESRSDYVVVLRPDDRLSEHALYVMAEGAGRRRDTSVVYGDYDHVDDRGVRSRPHFKPQWNNDLFLQHNVFHPLAALRRDLVQDAGSFREGFNGHADWDLALRVVERAGPDSIVHVPFVLCHVGKAARDGQAHAEGERLAAARRAVSEHLARTGVNADVEVGGTGEPDVRVRWRLPESLPLVSLIIPTRDRLDLLKPCIESLITTTDYPAYEVIVVDNGSSDPAAIAYLDGLHDHDGVEVLKVPGPFNFSRLCNIGVESAKGEVYVLLNNDTRVFRGNWLEELVRHAVRPDVGAVGAKLYYPAGGIQHAGVILGIWGTAGHAYRGAPSDSGGYQGRANVTQELSAVTAACLAGRRSLYRQLGGFDEVNVGIRYNDVDFCLRVRQAGHKVIWTPHAELFHHESGSRGKSVDPEKRASILSEIKHLERRWGPVLLADPAYNPNLTLGAETFRRTGRPRVTRPWLARTGR